MNSKEKDLVYEAFFMNYIFFFFLNSRGEQPLILRKARLKEELELKPLSAATSVMALLVLINRLEATVVRSCMR